MNLVKGASLAAGVVEPTHVWNLTHPPTPFLPCLTLSLLLTALGPLGDNLTAQLFLQISALKTNREEAPLEP